MLKTVPLREGFLRDVLPARLRGTFHLNDPDDRLAFLIPEATRSPPFVQLDKVHLEVGRRWGQSGPSRR